MFELIKFKSLLSSKSWCLLQRTNSCFLKIFFFLWNFIINWNTLEVFQWNELNNETPWERNNTNWQTDQVLFCVESMALCNNSTNLNHTNLSCPFNNPHNDESGVAEEVGENVQFFLLDLSGVYLIEQLQENENLEHKCEVNDFLGFISNLKIQWWEISIFRFKVGTITFADGWSSCVLEVTSELSNCVVPLWLRVLPSNIMFLNSVFPEFNWLCSLI